MPPLIASPAMLGPVLGLNMWTFVMEGWLYAKRLPALQKYGVTPVDGITKEEIYAKTPREVHYPAENYSHLFEQPVQFYAIAITMSLLRVESRTDLGLAWGYVGLRVIHSLIQSTKNKIMPRFLTFLASSFVLLAMAVRTGKKLL
ncbi:hypothetical protein P152DRAFT_475736 [Eremomyces bilateralis CBS 781.70]|uniref:Membrane-associated proteins in eicosanoid and glutathione metabolism n=1 Tax=Eremomyces bilateralis CBS 781.70 TaxID=1392243 RepID=A0A6G1FWU6_9PEZI|nr:uncharacterized protein P152DRAFT_475736 [Eremomyces bilateralis CBS 781.70]KAF1810161.1 hypothetical protein P152DRAFT_475736 [Eremomyces bilateralis CBS 781.70]